VEHPGEVSPELESEVSQALVLEVSQVLALGVSQALVLEEAVEQGPPAGEESPIPVPPIGGAGR
jgi:hypothetical protein